MCGVFFGMAKDVEDLAEESGEPDNKDLVMRLISDAESGAYQDSVVKIETDGRSGVAFEYVGTVAAIDRDGKMISIDEAQAREGCPMRAIKSYEWQD